MSNIFRATNQALLLIDIVITQAALFVWALWSLEQHNCDNERALFLAKICWCVVAQFHSGNASRIKECERHQKSLEDISQKQTPRSGEPAGEATWLTLGCFGGSSGTSPTFIEPTVAAVAQLKL
jgi:hypothetical protein